MRLLISLLMPAFLVGCVTNGSVFDPVPYQPVKSSALEFSSLEDAKQNLATYADGYASKRDKFMRDQMFFDIPLLGLAAGTVASGIYGAHSDLILGLGLGAASVGAGRVYFGPEGRIAAYHEAATSLACASSVALSMKAVDDSYRSRAENARTGLISEIAIANRLIVVARTSATDRAELLAARDQGQKALNKISAAVDTLDGAVMSLSVFARNVINSTTSKVVIGVQKYDAALAIINATPTTVPIPDSDGVTPLAAQGVPLPTPTQVIDKLKIKALEAENIAKQINDSWANLTGCSMPS